MITDGLELIDPHAYAAQGYPHDVWTRLRSEAPVYWCEPPGFEPFWAITRHLDICEISKQPQLFRNELGPMVLTDAQIRSMRDRIAAGEPPGFGGMRTLIEMDPPEHRAFRAVANRWFTPNKLRNLDQLVEESARKLVDELAERGDEPIDFVQQVAARHPLRILSRILGIEESDEPYLLRATNELFASSDPEFQREEDHDAAMMQLGLELYQFFSKIIADRRASPRDDLASLLANARLEDGPMGDVETFGYYLIVFTAGHDTTRNAITGGLKALIEHPEQAERLRADPGLTPRAVEEIVRFTTPVNYMTRLAAHDVDLGGQEIRRGQKLALFYASANRDEDVFERPFDFDVARHPNRHLGFGIGEHFCLGANLARQSSRALFAELIARLEEVELAGPPEYVASSFVTGIKHLPIRYRIS
ncbi:MAG: cytochrome P450 [Myxococcales bacterium]|nr:cytochrome P450 [Myxococcales bacterium]